MFFDEWGEFYIDRRFLTADELKRVKEIESFVWKHLIEPLQGAKVLPRGGATVAQTKVKPVKRAPRVHAGASARPAADRPKGFFDGWPTALRRYNGRRDRTDTDRYYSEEYADKIVRRASNPDLFVPIEIKLAK